MDKEQEATTEANSESNNNTVNLPIEEYNQIQATLKQYEQDLAYNQKTLEDFKRQSSTSKNQAENVPKPNSKQEVELMKNSMQEQLDKVTQSLESYKGKLKNTTIKNQLLPEISKIFIADAHNWILQDITKEVGLDGEDFENPKLMVKDPQGNARWSKIKTNERMNLGEYIEELKTRFPSFVATNFKGGEGSGSNSFNKTSSTNGGQVSTQQIARMSQSELTDLAKTPEGKKALQDYLRGKRF